MYVASKVFAYVGQLGIDPDNRHVTDVTAFIDDVVCDRLVRCGLKRDVAPSGDHEDECCRFSRHSVIFLIASTSPLGSTSRDSFPVRSHGSSTVHSVVILTFCIRCYKRCVRSLSCRKGLYIC